MVLSYTLTIAFIQKNTTKTATIKHKNMVPYDWHSENACENYNKDSSMCPYWQFDTGNTNVCIALPVSNF